MISNENCTRNAFICQILKNYWSTVSLELNETQGLHCWYPEWTWIAHMDNRNYLSKPTMTKILTDRSEKTDATVSDWKITYAIVAVIPTNFQKHIDPLLNLLGPVCFENLKILARKTKSNFENKRKKISKPYKKKIQSKRTKIDGMVVTGFYQMKKKHTQSLNHPVQKSQATKMLPGRKSLPSRISNEIIEKTVNLERSLKKHKNGQMNERKDQGREKTETKTTLFSSLSSTRKNIPWQHMQLKRTWGWHFRKKNILIER